MVKPIILLVLSNIFMTYAWYGHLKDMRSKPLVFAILVSWAVAFFEYCLQVPANRFGANVYTIPQLKIIQEVVTLVVFVLFSAFYLGVKPTMNYLYAGVCLLGAVFFIFRDFSGAN